MRDGYLIDIDQREHEAVERLVSMPGVYDKFLWSLGLIQCFSWYLLRRPASSLVADVTTDVDLLAGPLEWNDEQRFASAVAEEAARNSVAHPSWHQAFAGWRVAAEGGIRWPPSLDYLVAVEAKCAYLPADAPEISVTALKSTKQSGAKLRRLQVEVDLLVSMGFDRVAVLNVIANPPGRGMNSQAWFAGSAIAIRTMDALGSILQPPQPPWVGHYIWSPAAVAGGDERWSGGGAPMQRRAATDNPLRSTDPVVQSHRREMDDNLQGQLGVLRQPLRFPVILVHCATCGRIHEAGGPSCAS